MVCFLRLSEDIISHMVLPWWQIWQKISMAVAFLMSNSEHHLNDIFEINIDPILITLKCPYGICSRFRRNGIVKKERMHRRDKKTWYMYHLHVMLQCFFYGDNNDGHLFFCPLPIRDLVSQSSRYDRRVSGVSRHPPGNHYHHHRQFKSLWTKTNKQTIHQCMYITRNNIIMWKKCSPQWYRITGHPVNSYGGRLWWNCKTHNLWMWIKLWLGKCKTNFFDDSRK